MAAFQTISFTPAKSSFGLQAIALLSLAAPIAISQVSRVGISVVDTIFAGHASAAGLAAVGLGSAIWFAIFFFVSGVLLMAQPLMGSRVATNDPATITRTAEQVWLNSLFWGALSVFLLLASGAMIAFADLEPEVAVIVRDYLWVIALGAPASALFQGLKFSFDGVGDPSRGMRISIFGFLINIPLNYALVFGGAGFEGLGVIGCAWATTLTYWLMLAALLRSSRIRPIAPATRMVLWPRPNREDQRYLFAKGVPTGMAIVLDAGFFSAIAWLAVNFGTVTVAANQIVVSFISLLFVGQIALSMAISIRVAQSETMAAKKRVALTGTALSVVLSLIYIALIALFAPDIIGLYTRDTEVARIALTILSVAVLFQFADSIQVCAAGALRGMHDSFLPMIIVGLAYWAIALPIALVLIHTDWLMPLASIADIWTGLAIGISTAAVFLTSRFWLMTKRDGAPSAVHPDQTN